MAKGKTPASAAIKAASVAGRALGAVAGRFDALKARHPDPLSEAGRALGKGQAKVRALASEAAATSKAAVAGTKAVLANTTRAAKRARRKGTKAVAAATKATKKLTKQATKSVTRAKKTVARRAASLKP